MSLSWCCENKRILEENFDQVYKGFNDDIRNDLFGGNEADPCCTPMPTCGNQSNGTTPQSREGGRMQPSCSQSQCQGQRSRTNEASENTVHQCQFSNQTGSQPKRDPSYCYTKTAFKPSKVYVGFNEGLYGKYTGCQ